MTPRPRKSERLDRDLVLTSALELADRAGIEAITLRRVAAIWNVTPMALYWHFTDKDALLDAMVERMLAEVALPADADLRAAVEAVLEVLRSHPALAEIVALRVLRCDAGIALTDRVLALLRAEGHSAEAAAQVSMFVLNGLVDLVTRQPGDAAVLDPVTRESVLAAKRGRLESLSPDALPHLSASAGYFLDTPDAERYFRRGLDFLLAGARAIAESPDTRSTQHS